MSSLAVLRNNLKGAYIFAFCVCLASAYSDTAGKISSEVCDGTRGVFERESESYDQFLESLKIDKFFLDKLQPLAHLSIWACNPEKKPEEAKRLLHYLCWVISEDFPGECDPPRRFSIEEIEPDVAEVKKTGKGHYFLPDDSKYRGMYFNYSKISQKPKL